MRPSLSFGFSGLAFVLAASAMARPDLNSFVNRKVSTTKDLVTQVRTDREVADRYQRHFAMNRQELVAYLGTLHRDTLSREGVYTIYSVPTDGHVKMHVEKLKKGEPMFVDASGKPTLVVKCGNPVVLGPSRVRRGNPVVVTPTEPSGERTLVLAEPRLPDVEDRGELVALMPPVPEVVTPPAPPLVVEQPPAPYTPTVPATATGGGSNFPWYLGLPLLIPVFGHGGDGGGGGGTEPVPEPATMVVLGLGAVAMVRRRRKA